MKSRIIFIIALSLFIMMVTVFVGEPYSIRGLEEVASIKPPKVQDENHLWQLLKAFEKRNSINNYGFFSRGIKEIAVESAESEEYGSQSNDYSDTNIQVKGVDEGDIIKTDGEYIYHLQHHKLNVYMAYPAEKLRFVSSLEFGEDFNFLEIYLHDEQLIVIGNKTEHNELKPNATGAYSTPHYNYYRNFTKVIVLDRKSKDLKVLKEFEIEGDYFSSRKVNDSLYMVSNKNMYTYLPMPRIIVNGKYEYKEKQVIETPYYKEDNSEMINIPVEDIYYFPNFTTPEYMTISTINLKDLSSNVHLETYIGASHSIYASTENLYIANTIYQEVSTWNRNAIGETTTEIHKIKLQDGKTSYAGMGLVNGKILNQFSMDEKDGYFRIATTTGDIWRDDEFTSKNHLFILDNKLEVVGSVNNIAPTERIYSMRFIGDKAYMVTFRETDPFFVIDVKDPTNPKIQGYLKIPGYSNYLHPYDENHIIGFGKEVYETKQGFLDGGLKIAVFDVSDVSNPIEKYKVEIGGRGTHSQLLNNHKALLFDATRNLLALPVTVYSEEESTNNFWKGNFKFQGAYVYHLDMENGFNLKGEITHYTEDDYQKAGIYHYYGDKDIQRIIRIDDVLYTVSEEMIKANKLDDLKEIKSIIHK
ncbi:beta-propeller domain-containing protein [Alkaliphilus peptidifermentans]|uniref:Secreted protein containing C-terminal beta-propeller domain n=1 Tax=Alkaliphilus peptidifermentans DSM 18978 TaxID=1120976 RepID=A0A1G5L4Q4_9FIRM|nr:beta-propeller domain-containing protein [Alkaliphilus peptidifermentans]SCZ07862.1 Secreted protein containing C-terminal beta-propeller domain [Alkaliphilus peptidifermentans DSM 18978]